MKKNISINLQGIIFHIEEDGYEQLSRYLASIRTYFSNYEGHEEIVADIESRIAEIFSMRLSPGKQVITLEDVQALITQMGDVTDFEVMEPMEETSYYSTAGAGAGAGFGSGAESGTYTHAGPRRLYRDSVHKVVGGVCAGIANYLNIDTLWLRLFFILLVVFGIVSAGFSTATGIILYVILWIAMPQSALLPETTVKKLYRDPEDKKLGGVASGIAKYFGTDVTVIRILFIVFFFAGGFGLLTYIILWIAVPEAVTLTERMQMQGSPVTLAGIERTLKANLNMKDRNGEESTLAKIILLPIRLISQVFSWLSRALGPVLAFLLTFIRIGAGIFLLILSVVLIISLITAFLASLGWMEIGPEFSIGTYPASIMLEGFPRLGLVAGFFVGLIPLLLLMYLSIGLLIKRFVMTAMVGWSMFALWLVSLVVLIITIASFAGNFKRNGEVVTSRTIPVDNYQTLVLDAYDTNLNFDRVYIEMKEHNASNVEIIQKVNAKGRTEEDAKLNAQMITYNVLHKDSVLRFDNSYEFKKGASFRDQDLDIVLMLPKGKPLRLTRDFIYMLPSATFDRDYSNEKIVRNTWQVKGDMLECITCATDTLDVEEPREFNTNSEDGFNMEVDAFGDGESVLLNMSEYGNNSKTYNFRNFDRVSISGPYHVQLQQGNTHSIRVRGDERELERMEVEQNGNELEINFEEKTINLFDDRKPILIQITAPDIKDILLSGAIKADLNTGNSTDLNVELTGATKAALNTRARNLKLDIAGASATKVTGTTERFELNASGACSIDADALRARTVIADVSGMTLADLYASSSLRIDAAGASRITYKGNPASTDIDASGASKVERK